MRTITALAFLFLINIPSYSQTSEDITKISMMNDEMTEKLKAISSPVTGRKKTFYIEKSWEHLIVVTEDDEVLHANGRIDILNNKVELRIENRLRSLHEGRVKALMVNGNVIFKVPARKIDNSSRDKYMRVVSLGKYTLLEGYKISFKLIGAGGFHPEIDANEEPFVDSDLYYTPDFNEVTYLKGKKAVFELFDDKSDLIEQFVEINKIKFKNKDDVSILFRYYNDLFNG